jgi:hypothetical protein
MTKKSWTMMDPTEDILGRADRPRLSPDVRRGLEILQQLGLSSTAKFVKMREWACPADGRARGGILYHGAEDSPVRRLQRCPPAIESPCAVSEKVDRGPCQTCKHAC